MVKVTKEQFYDIVCHQRLDVFPRSRVEAGRYPWPCDWKFRSGQLFGVNYPLGRHYPDSERFEYFVIDEYAPERNET